MDTLELSIDRTCSFVDQISKFSHSSVSTLIENYDNFNNDRKNVTLNKECTKCVNADKNICITKNAVLVSKDS